MASERIGTWIALVSGVVVGTAATGFWMEARTWRGEMERRVLALETRPEVVARPAGGASPHVDDGSSRILTAARPVETPKGCGTSDASSPASDMKGAADGGVSAIDWLVAAEGES